MHTTVVYWLHSDQNSKMQALFAPFFSNSHPKAFRTKCTYNKSQVHLSDLSPESLNNNKLLLTSPATETTQHRKKESLKVAGFEFHVRLFWLGGSSGAYLGYSCSDLCVRHWLQSQVQQFSRLTCWDTEMASELKVERTQQFNTNKTWVGVAREVRWLVFMSLPGNTNWKKITEGTVHSPFALQSSRSKEMVGPLPNPRPVISKSFSWRRGHQPFSFFLFLFFDDQVQILSIFLNCWALSKSTVGIQNCPLGWGGVGVVEPDKSPQADNCSDDEYTWLRGHLLKYCQDDVGSTHMFKVGSEVGPT